MLNKPGPNALRVAYCGPIARPGRPARGGYEFANRRLIDDLRLRGVDVLEMPYPVACGTETTKIIAYLSCFVGIVINLVRQRSRFDILHLTPLYGRFLYPEALLHLVGWTLRKRVLLDIRAGCFVRLYRERSSLYRALVDRLLCHADILALEGMEDLDFVETRRDTPIVYLPNYVSKVPVKPAKRRSRGALRLIHLGRIVPEKGIELTIGALEHLLSKGLDAHLEVIGTGHPGYVAMLKEKSRDLPVNWKGALSPDKIRARLATAHFFVFPTLHFGEGHSNALTEAMAEGLVPVCSEHGFNRSVVANTGRLLPSDASASDYAEMIASIWTAGLWSRLSSAAQERVRRHFTADAVLAGLINQYQTF